MSEAIQLDDYIDETRADSYPSRTVARKSGGSGGDMDDVLKRLGAVESSVSELRIQVSGIAATMVTKDEHNELKVQISSIAAMIPNFATKADLYEIKAQVSGIVAMVPSFATKADLYAMETKIIKWIIATVLTTAGLVFTIAKFVH